MFIVEWFQSMTLAGQIFACVAIPSTLVLLIQTVLMAIGVGSESDGFADEIPDGDVADADVPDDVSDGVFGTNEVSDVVDNAGLDGLRIFTFRGVIAFLVVFGWVGVLMDHAGCQLWLTALVATLCGAAMMIVMSLLIRAVMKLRDDGNADNRNAIGVSGKVHLFIPAKRRGDGKVHLMLQGSYVERDAVTDDEEAIPTGSEVTVIGLSGQTTLVVTKK